MSPAEWAVARLQAEAAFQLEAMQSAASEANDHGSTSMDDASTKNIADTPAYDREHPGTLIGRYHCTSRNRHGNLTVTTQDVSFKQHLTKDRSWRLRYDQLKAIEKVPSSRSSQPALIPAFPLSLLDTSPALSLYLTLNTKQD